MRELKFRAWDKTPGLEPRMMDEFGFGSEEQRYGVNENIKRYAEHPNWIIMQYTGLKDKNGKEIYEGDVVRAWSESTGENHPEYDLIRGAGTQILICEIVEPLRVRFAQKQNGLFDFQPYEVKDLEIIGNIYQHKDLLK